MTRLIHGENGLLAAQRITQALFSDEILGLDESDFMQLQQDGLPSSRINRADLAEVPLTQLLVDVELAASGKQIKDALQRSAVFINGEAKSWDHNMRTHDCFALDSAFFGRFYLVKLGKKKYHLFEVA